MRIYIDRKRIAENRQARMAGQPTKPPIMVESEGNITHVDAYEGGNFRVVYRPKALREDGGPVDPDAPEVWVEVV